ncbi:hypothetical protein E4U42_003557 [Claviceps africana]|uniref:WSC domain-containing protein n=1 Tax=Claviceps africana TaxID=83212 RepID=A0A8K0J6E5_9HYPO|nr:hypothetical protein E4U42_003557 [Claviceps africana]
MAVLRSALALVAMALLPLTHAWNIELPPCTEPFKPFVYSGCFQEGKSSNTLLLRSSLDTANMTVEMCMAECKGNGFRYAGLEYYGVCFCGATVDGPQADESQCSFPCSGDKTQKCGGDRALSVWQDPTFPNAEKLTVDAYKSLGCYTDDSSKGRTLSYPIDFGGELCTPKTCLAACEKRGFPFAGIEYGNECYCGVVLANDTTKVDSSQCNTPCLDDASTKCGGSARLSLWIAKDLWSLEPCVHPPGLESTTPPVITTTTRQPSKSATTSSIDTTTTKPAETTTTTSTRSTPSQPTTTSSTSSPGQLTTTSSHSSPSQPTTSYCDDETSVSSQPVTTTKPASTTTAAPIKSTAQDTTTSYCDDETSASSQPVTTTKPAGTPVTPIQSTGQDTTTSYCDDETSTSSQPVTTSKPASTTATPSQSTGQDTTTSYCDDETSTSSQPVTTSKPASTTATPIRSTGQDTTTSYFDDKTSTSSQPARTTATPIQSTGQDTTTSYCDDETSTSSQPLTATSKPASTTATSIPIQDTTPYSEDKTSSSSRPTPSTKPADTTTQLDSTTTQSARTTSRPADTTTQKPTTTTRQIPNTTTNLCTATVTVPAKCEWQCGQWCAPALPSWQDSNGCQIAKTTCHKQISSCFKQAGWPGAVECFKFQAWCRYLDGYCTAKCPGKACGKSDCWNGYHSGGGGGGGGGGGRSPASPPTTTTSVYACGTTSQPAPTPTKPAVPCPPQHTNLCTQPTNDRYGYGPGKPVGGIALPVVGCNDRKDDFNARPYKLYTEPESRDCPAFRWSQWPSVCSSACKEQYNQCMATYSKGCETLGWRSNLQKKRSEGSSDEVSKRDTSFGLGINWGINWGNWGGSSGRGDSDSGSCAVAGWGLIGSWLRLGSDDPRCWGYGGNKPDWARARCEAQYTDCQKVNRWVKEPQTCQQWSGC